MSTLETNQAEPNLNNQLTEDELFARMTAAIEADDQDEITRLMSVEPIAQDPETTDEPEEDGQPDDNPAEPEPQSNDSDVNTATPDPAPAGSPPDIHAELQALREALHVVQSKSGRVDYLQRELARVTKELEKQKAATAASEPKQPRRSEELVNNLREVDPVTADALGEILKEIDQRTAAPAPQTFDDDEVVRQEFERVLAVHPEAEQIFSGAGRPYWDAFKATLTPEQLEWAESDKAEKVVMALNAFKHWVNQAYTQPAAPAIPSVPAQAPTQQPPSEIAETRARKLSGQAPMRNPTIKQVEDLQDPKKLFDEVYNQTLKDLNIKV